MARNRVLVMGATGKIGSAVAAQLLAMACPPGPWFIAKMSALQQAWHRRPKPSYQIPRGEPQRPRGGTR
jgi:nucleoside-diphosphate-sugar epimerase